MSVYPAEEYRKDLAELTWALEREGYISKENNILILHHINSPKKLEQFKAWGRSRLVDDRLEATEAEIARAATKIYKGETPD